MGVGGQCHTPSHFTPGKDPVPIEQEAGLTPGPLWTGAENLAFTGFQSPNCPVLSESLYRISYPGLWYTHHIHTYIKVKESRNRPGVAQRVPGGLGSQISMTFGTWRQWGCQPHAPAALTPKKCSWYSFSLGAESTPGSWYGQKEYVTEKSSDTTRNRSWDRPTGSAAPWPLRHPRPIHTHIYIHTTNSYKSDNSPVIISNHQLFPYLTTWSKSNKALFLENVQYRCILAVDRTFTELRNKGYHSVLSLQEVVYADLQPSAWKGSTIAVSGEKIVHEASQGQSSQTLVKW